MFDLNKMLKFVETTKELMINYPLMDEANTKQKIISPFLQLLGWDINYDTMLEYPVKIGSKTINVDYALLIEGNPAVFIEARGVDSPVDKNESVRAINYSKIEGVKWTVVTNGKTFSIYNTNLGKKPDQCLLATIDIDDFISEEKTLWLLSKKSILSGEIETAVDTILQTQKLIKKINEKKENLSLEIANIIKKLSDKSLYKKIEDLSKELLANLTIRLESTPKDSEKRVALKSLVATSNSPILKEIKRSSIQGDPRDLVALFPVRPDAVEFILKYQTWGYVRIRQTPKYIAFYVTKPYGNVLYFGEIDTITKKFSSIDEVENIKESNIETFKPGKQIIYLKKDSLKRFLDPIPFQSNKQGWAPQSLMYTTVEKIKSANNTKDL